MERKYTSIGELYFDSSMFSSEDPAAQTIGMPIVGSNALEILENRRKVKGRLSDAGAAELTNVMSKLKAIFPDAEFKVTWDKYCGCSMCPCSPGYRIKANIKTYMPSNKKYRFSLHVDADENGASKYSFFRPKDSWVIGYKEVEKIQNAFSNEQTVGV